MTLYFISGLGADKRIFQKLAIPEGYKVCYLDWLVPESSESLAAYSRRLAELIDASEEFVLVGLSFGGMVATEISQVLHPKDTIIISSAGCRSELPWYFRLASNVRLDRIIPIKLLKIHTPFTYWLFGARSGDSKQLLRLIIRETRPDFLKWAIKAILSWKRTIKPPGIYHIHGVDDHLLPAAHVKADLLVPGGGHLMVFDKAKKLSDLIGDRIKSNK